MTIHCQKAATSLDGRQKREATSAFSKDRMYAAHELNGPTFAQAILTTDELLAVLPKS